MNFLFFGNWTYLGFILAIILAFSVKIIYQFERGVKFTLGKYSGLMEPGLRLIIPFIQTYEKIDLRQKTIDLKPQQVMTSDKVSLTIDGIVFFRVSEPEKVVLNVEDLYAQLEGKATSELKEIIGGMTMTDSLANRDDIAIKLQKRLQEAVDDKDETDKNKKKDWGVTIKAIQINNIVLPEELVRAMSKQAEAEREREARVTKAKGEEEASKKFNEASKIYKNNFAALRLRELQTYQEIGTEHNTLMMVIPSSMATGDAKWLLPFIDKAEKQKK